MKKAELINAMSVESGMNKLDVKKALDAFVVSVTKAMKAGERLSLVGFGTFSVNERSERMGVNPSTKEPIQIAARKVVKFKPGTELSEAVQ